MFDAFRRFFTERGAALKRIARQAGGQEVAEVESEAWLIASDIEQRSGRPLDLGDPVDQETLLGALYNRLVKFAEKHLRFAFSLDDDSDDEASPGALIGRLLRAPESSSPETALIRAEEEEEQLQAVIDQSYSEAAAYLVLLSRFGWQAAALAEFVNLREQTLRGRMRLAGHRAASEPTLFDGVSKISLSFSPLIRLRRCSTPPMPPASFSALELFKSS